MTRVDPPTAAALGLARSPSLIVFLRNHEEPFLVGLSNRYLLIIILRFVFIWLGKYRVSQQVSDLGWVDLDLGCSTILPGSR